MFSMQKALKVSRVSVLALSCAALLVPAITSQVAEARHHKHHRHVQQNNIMAVAKKEADLSTFTAAVAAAGLTKTLEGKGPFTVFAPSNKAFSKFPKAQLDGLLKDQEQLKNILLFHVLPKKVMAADIPQGRYALTTVQGEKLHTNVKDSSVVVGGALVTKADIPASNGVIHIIDDVLTPISQPMVKKN